MTVLDSLESRTDPRAGRVEAVAETLGRRIAAGRHPPDTALPTEPELAAALGVGRNVVREAVKMLAGKGLLRTGRRAGTIVRPQEEWNVLDASLLTWLLDNPEERHCLIDELIELRAIIEPEAVALAAERAKVSQTLRIWEAFEAMEAAAAGPASAVDPDVLFHRLLFEAADSRLLLGMFRAFELLLRVNFSASLMDGSAFTDNLGFHRRIAVAVQNGDPEQARAAMRELVAKNRADVARARNLASSRRPSDPT